MSAGREALKNRLENQAGGISYRATRCSPQTKRLSATKSSSSEANCAAPRPNSSFAGRGAVAASEGSGRTSRPGRPRSLGTHGRCVPQNDDGVEFVGGQHRLDHRIDDATAKLREGRASGRPYVAGVHTVRTVSKLTTQLAAKAPMTAGKITAGRWLLAGLGVIVVVAGVFMAWTTLSPRGRHFTRTHDRAFRRQQEQQLTAGQAAVLRVFTLCCAGLFSSSGA